MRRSCLTAALFTLLVASATVVVPSRDVAAGATGTCPTFEAPVEGVPVVPNPFDPASADIQVDFTAPSGTTYTTPAFFTQDYTRALVAGNEQLTPTGAGHWVVRFTPTEPGSWDWSAAISINSAAPMISPTETFSCEPDAWSHGFLRRSPDDQRYLRWDDGTQYTALGENLSWYDQRGTHAYDVWLDRLADHDANWIRIWMPSWAFGLEWIRRGSGGVIVENSLGDYTTRLDRAWQLDYVIEAARVRGIVVQLVFQNHGAFSTSANSEWADNPYNAANGGPLADPTDFFTDSASTDLFARRMRYIVARWGYATNLVWEFWNEVDLTGATPSEIIAWHADMGDRLRALDPYGHLQTTSLDGGLLADQPTWSPLFALPQIDMSQVHFYGIGDAAPLDFTDFIPGALAGLLALGKPVLLAEAGVDFRGPVETIAADPTGQGFHELLWSGLFSGGYGSGMTWWWDNVIDPQDQYATFDGLNTLTAGVALDRQGLALDGTAAVAGDGATLATYPLRGRDTVLVWVRNPANWWHEPDFTAIETATLDVQDLVDGAWRIEWIDPFTAAVSDGGVVGATDGHASVPIPTFAGETALRLTLTAGPTPSEPPPTASPIEPPASSVEPRFTG